MNALEIAGLIALGVAVVALALWGAGLLSFSVEIEGDDGKTKRWPK